MKHEDLDLDLRKVSVEKQEGEARRTIPFIPTSTIKCRESIVQPTTGMTQACCNRNIEMDKDIKVRCQ